MEPSLENNEPQLSLGALNEVKKLAYLSFSISDIAIQVEIDEFHALRWMTDRFHPFFIAVNSGRLEFERELRESLIDLAKFGDPGALKVVSQMIEKQKILDS